MNNKHNSIKIKAVLKELHKQRIEARLQRDYFTADTLTNKIKQVKQVTKTPLQKPLEKLTQ